MIKSRVKNENLENAKRMEELERKNSLKKAAYELSKVTPKLNPNTNVTCSLNEGSTGAVIEPKSNNNNNQSVINQPPPGSSTKNMIRRFSWENVDHKNSLKSLWDNNK